MKNKNQQSKSNTLTDPRWKREENLQKQKHTLQCGRQTNWKTWWRLVKYRRVQYELQRQCESERERERRRMFVCDNILKKNKTRIERLITRKQNKPTSNQHIEQANDEGCWKLVRMLTCGRRFLVYSAWKAGLRNCRRDSLPARNTQNCDMGHLSGGGV